MDVKVGDKVLYSKVRRPPRCTMRARDYLIVSSRDLLAIIG